MDQKINELGKCQAVTSPIKFTDTEGRECELVKQHRDWRYVYTEAPTPADLAACGYVPRAELERVAGLLGNLLARIHGDGGHRQVALGDEEAAAQADAIVVRMRATLGSDPHLGHQLNFVEWCLQCGHLGEPGKSSHDEAAEGALASFDPAILAELGYVPRAELEKTKANELAAINEMAKARRAAQDAQSSRDTLVMIGMQVADEFVAGSLVKRLFDRCLELERRLKATDRALAAAEKEEGI